MKDHWNYDRAVLHRTDIAETEVVDPHQPPGQTDAKTTVLRSLRDDQLGQLYSRKQIDLAQYKAGRAWECLYERSAIGLLRAIDTTKEPVDGRRIPEILNDVNAEAAKDLWEIAWVLGYEGNKLVSDVLGKGWSFQQCAAARGNVSEGGVKFLGKRFRECLDTLAVEFGFASKERARG